MGNLGASDEVFKYTSSGTPLGGWTITGAGTKPKGITTERAGGSNLWIADRDTSQVFQFTGSVSRISGSQTPDAFFSLAPANSRSEGIQPSPAGRPM